MVWANVGQAHSDLWHLDYQPIRIAEGENFKVLLPAQIDRDTGPALVRFGLGGACEKIRENVERQFARSFGEEVLSEWYLLRSALPPAALSRTTR